MWELASGFAQGVPNKCLEGSKKKQNSQIFLFLASFFVKLIKLQQLPKESAGAVLGRRWLLAAGSTNEDVGLGLCTHRNPLLCLRSMWNLSEFI